jgi:hypothetical protein
MVRPRAAIIAVGGDRPLGPRIVRAGDADPGSLVRRRRRDFALRA